MALPSSTGSETSSNRVVASVVDGSTRRTRESRVSSGRAVWARLGYLETKIAWSRRMTATSECRGCVQVESKSFQVVKTCAPLAVCLPS
jgi:hypothetical protein